MYFLTEDGILVTEENGLSWKSKEISEAKHSVYSDRLYQWNAKKFNECCNIVWNNSRQYFSNRTPEEIEKFLSLYFTKEIKLVAIYEYENASNGFPYWRFDYC